MIRFFLLFAYFTLLCSLQAQHIEFYREDLNFRLDTGSFEVDGYYYFRNTAQQEIRQLLYYPFPPADQYGAVTALNITRKDDTVSQIVSSSPMGSLFKLWIQPGGEVCYHIGYTQKLQSREARYILTSTQFWGEELERAHYSLEFRSELDMESVSIEPDSVKNEKGVTRYVWERRKFMPKVDFIFLLRNN